MCIFKWYKHVAYYVRKMKVIKGCFIGVNVIGNMSKFRMFMFVIGVFLASFRGVWYLPIGGTWELFIPISVNPLRNTMKLQNISWKCWPLFSCALFSQNISVKYIPSALPGFRTTSSKQTIKQSFMLLVYLEVQLYRFIKFFLTVR